MSKPHVVLYASLASLAGVMFCCGVVLVGIGAATQRNRYHYFTSTPVTPQTATVLVATRDIPPDTLISHPETMFRVRLYRAGTEPKGSITSNEALRFQVLDRELQKGEPCTAADLHRGLNRLFQMPDGTRAMLIAGNADQPIAPGQMVDVVVSEAQLNIPQAINTLFIVRNVKVLAVHTWPTQNQVLPPNWTSLVVAVTPEQGEKLGTASPPRQSSIVLRQPGN